MTLKEIIKNHKLDLFVFILVFPFIFICFLVGFLLDKFFKKESVYYTNGDEKYRGEYL